MLIIAAAPAPHCVAAPAEMLQNDPHGLDVGLPVHPRGSGYPCSLRCSWREEHRRALG